MGEYSTRRQFLHQAGAALAAIAATPASSLGASVEPAAARLTLACRDVQLKFVGEKDCWSALKRIGAEGVEVGVLEDLSLPHLFHPEQEYSVATPEGIARLQADLKAAGLKVTAFAMDNRFEQRPELEITWSTKVAGVAQALGVPAIRIDVVPHKLARPEFLNFSIGVLKKLVEATEPTGVAFGIENHGNTTNDPTFLRALFNGVGSKRLGLTLDTANFYWYGHPLSKLYAIYETFASRVFHTHCKSIHYPESEREKQRPIGWKYGEYHGPIYSGDIDFHRVVSILRKAGYHNDLCVEDESLWKAPQGEAAEVLSKEIRYLKGLAG